MKAQLNTSVLLERIRTQKPLVHHITNWVTIYDCANATRSIGALPVMAHAPEEVPEMTGIAQALVLNIGTLTTELIESMKLAGQAANQKGIPVILDAVGAGATRMRSQKTKELLSTIQISVLKGNSAEIGSVAGVAAEVKGVEAISVGEDPLTLAPRLAQQLNLTVVITGKTDYVSNGIQTYAIRNGHELMGKVVGTGCMSASIIGAFCAIEKDYAQAAASALSAYGIAGEMAARHAKGPGTFKEHFVDALHHIGANDIRLHEKVDTE
ncbi:MAG: hydroxyethylthiazole kinase [Candidatus Diapherotrites archaeon]|nr:hydroxyethylthiazole kinase [Candidatus Diapherotrites archaeon]